MTNQPPETLKTLKWMLSLGDWSDRNLHISEVVSKLNTCHPNATSCTTEATRVLQHLADAGTDGAWTATCIPNPYEAQNIHPFPSPIIFRLDPNGSIVRVT